MGQYHTSREQVVSVCRTLLDRGEEAFAITLHKRKRSPYRHSIKGPQ